MSVPSCSCIGRLKIKNSVSHVVFTSQPTRQHVFITYERSSRAGPRGLNREGVSNSKSKQFLYTYHHCTSKFPDEQFPPIIQKRHERARLICTVIEIKGISILYSSSQSLIDISSPYCDGPNTIHPFTYDLVRYSL